MVLERKVNIQRKRIDGHSLNRFKMACLRIKARIFTSWLHCGNMFKMAWLRGKAEIPAS